MEGEEVVRNKHPPPPIVGMRLLSDATTLPSRGVIRRAAQM
jgi:hypothetical protein